MKNELETNSQSTSEAELRFVRLCTDSVVPLLRVIFKKNITSQSEGPSHIFLQ